MKSTYVATQLTPSEHLDLGVAAAKAGTSRSAILRGLVQKFLAKQPTGGLNLRKGGRI